MKLTAAGRRRQTAGTWGAIAAVSLAGVLAALLGSPTAAGHALFGRPGSVVMATVAFIVTVAATLAIWLPAGTRRLSRWALALPVAIAAGGIGALAAAGLFAPSDGTDTGLGIVLALGTIGMSILATQVARGGPDESHTTPVKGTPRR